MTRQYDITRDAELRNFIDVERISPKSYVSISGWAFQGMRVDDHQKRIPIALPAMDARFLLDDRVQNFRGPGDAMRAGMLATLLVPVLAAALGLINGFRMARLPDIEPRADIEGLALG